MGGKLQKLLIVVPCYNEEEVFPQTVKVIGTLLDDLIAAKKSVRKAGSALLMTAVKTEHGS